MGTNRVLGDVHKSRVLRNEMCLNPGVDGSADAADLFVVPKDWKRGRVFLPPNPADGDTFEIFDEFDRTRRHPVLIDGSGYKITTGHKGHHTLKWGGGHDEEGNYDYDYDGDYEYDGDYDYDKDGNKGRHSHHGHYIRLIFTLKTGLKHDEGDRYRSDRNFLKGDGEDDCCGGRWFAIIQNARGPRGEKGERGERGEHGHHGERGERGEMGPMGPSGMGGATGAQGIQGIQGVQGPTGTPGATGAPGSTTIIPYASGLPVILTHVISPPPPAPPLVDTGAVLAFGNSASSIAIVGGTLDLSGAVGLVQDMAFSMPRAGSVVGMSAYFTNLLSLFVFPGTTMEIQVQLYISASPTSNIFNPILGANVILPLPNTLLIPPAATTVSGISSFAPVPVTAQDRLLLVANLNVNGIDLALTVTGYISAGLEIL